MEDLKQLRDRIDEIDEKLVNLFEERMETVLKVADYKKKNNIPILNTNREKEVITKNKLRLKNNDFEDSLESFFIHLMNLSKEEQKKIIF
ncbi:chorismate mutase [Tissierella praeacuta]|uniref:chorismate mutase n=1 Tax=Tissierella praeacuta TaxID=43131 RepID=UPI0033405330